jgi:hypothetical protein
MQATGKAKEKRNDGHERNREGQMTHKSPETWVYEVLEPNQFSTAKRPFGRRLLSRRKLLLLWVLRIYVIMMVLLIGLEIWNALHVAG